MEEQIQTKPYDGQHGRKRNYWKIFSIVVIVLIVLVGAYFGLSYLTNNAYNQGIQVGQYNLIARITQTGVIPYLDNSTGNLTILTTNSTAIIQNYISNLYKEGYTIVNAK